MTYLVNESGEEIVNYEYIDHRYSKDLLCFSQDGKYGFINTKGEVVVAPIYDNLIPSFFEDLAAAEVNNKWGFIGIDGKLKIMPKYDYAELFIDGLAPVRLDGKYGFMTKTYIINTRYYLQRMAML